MRHLSSAFLVFSFLFLFRSASAQVVTKTGEIYGRVADEQKLPLPSVLVTLESLEITKQQTETGQTGSFRFINLPPGIYTATFTLSAFAGVIQEEIRVMIGSRVELAITMNSSLLKEEIHVRAETALLDRSKTGSSFVFTQEYLGTGSKRTGSMVSSCNDCGR